MSRISRVLLFLSGLLWAAYPAAAQDLPVPAQSSFVLDLLAAQILATDGQHQEIGFSGAVHVSPAELVGAITFRNDGTLGEVQSGYWLGFGASLDRGGIAVDLSPFSLRAGRFTHDDLVTSPYSLFVSSSELSTVLLDLSISTPRLFYTTRWLGLNRDSALGYPDRGANLRTYGVAFNGFRVGFQDAIVYTDRTFNLEYLVNPLPGFFLQYIKGGSYVPWAESTNENSIMGFFADYTRPGAYAYAQLLVDDINANAILDPDSFQNPSKVAWSLGGRYAAGPGVLGLYHAGATKYTFQAYGGGSVGSASDTKYGYVYYPGVTYEVDGNQQIIAPQDNYIGYLHGENNIAFLAEYESPVGPVATVSSLELTISGSKSPANPWHEYNYYSEGGEGTRLLDDDRLETKIVASGRVVWPVGRWRVFADLSLGYVVNELELTDVPPELSGGDPDNSIPYFAPGSTNRFIGSLRLGGSYSLPVVKREDP